MQNILNDFTNFTRLRYDEMFSFTIKLEDKVNIFLNKLVSLNVLPSSEVNSLKPTGSYPAALYRLQKVHKASVPLRQIMAAYNTATYKTHKFFSSQLE